ncbi:MAG: 4'-phosphopantetheinyl transferase superfamily protein [Planctomycetes bacterium]|nr:4'-phosphopantetheinyl transferase superfamily protein [Planctomycetota bacterium]
MFEANLKETAMIDDPDLDEPDSEEPDFDNLNFEEPTFVPSALDETSKLEPGVVELWMAWVDSEEDTFARLEATLSEDELERAAEKDGDQRRRFITTRGILRELLASYAGVLPTELAFEYSEYGKPKVFTASGDGPYFNVSHTGDLALFAFSSDQEVGVDVEQVRARARLDEIAEKYFSPAEAEMVAGLMDEERDSLFASYWTRKEALYKAIGTGIANRPGTVDLSGMPVDGAEVSCPSDGGEDESWYVRDIEVEDGFRAALCCRSRPAELHCKDAFYD